MGLYKLMLFTYKRPTFLEFMEFFNKNFWMKKYENHGERIMGDSMKKCLFYVVSIVIVCHLSLSLNFIKPLIENRGKNESGRELPFPWYMSFPAHPQLTPAYEILFAMQMVAVFYVCLCYFSFDIFLCGINLTLVGEFSILQEDLEAVCDFDEVLDDSLRNRSCIYSQFAKCVNQHQILMYSADVLKDLYKNIVASFVVILSILICLAMYQVMTVRSYSSTPYSW
nr:odorant receptor 24 [Psyttalia incisi]